MTPQASPLLGQQMIPSDDRRDSYAGPEERAVERALTLMFLPLHKRNLGIAFGVACSIALTVVTLTALARGGEVKAALSLLSVFFRGYRVSWLGLLIGAAWAGGMGFVAGWFLAFCRNLVYASWLIIMRARATAGQTRDFLDHI